MNMHGGNKRAAEEAASRLQEILAKKSGDGASPSGGHVPRKKKSRWSNEDDLKTVIPGLSTIMPTGLSKTQQEAYLVQLQIEDVSRKLRSGDLGIPPNPADRSPSPEPTYDNQGKRLNTREYRTRRKLEDQRHELVVKMKGLNEGYVPPCDYKAPLIKYNERVVIPTDRPDINFVGLLIGPRGNTLKKLEQDSGTRIMIRGKGSAKDGTKQFGRKEMYPGEDEPLHAYITGATEDNCKRAAEAITKIIEEGLTQPDSENQLRRDQLMELAQLNGTIRDMGLRCANCGSYEHRTWNCHERQNVTHNIFCQRCGAAGHVARDCKADLSASSAGGEVGGAPVVKDRVKMDNEYLSLMEELGESTPKPTGADISTSHIKENPPAPPSGGGPRPGFRPGLPPHPSAWGMPPPMPGGMGPPPPPPAGGFRGPPPPGAWGPPPPPPGPYGHPPGPPPPGYMPPPPPPGAGGYGYPPPPYGGPPPPGGMPPPNGMPPRGPWGPPPPMNNSMAPPPPPPGAGSHAPNAYGAPPPPPPR
ncbi:splicing factor 1-like [Convolutriloba macropyga]|uniref:splicing factor 1-like n=1 Tax=Convolutriloba macropyga TaxID=536237 RepID=UPI003F52450E